LLPRDEEEERALLSWSIDSVCLVFSNFIVFHLQAVSKYTHQRYAPPDDVPENVGMYAEFLQNVMANFGFGGLCLVLIV
jgi:hypothetical protein